MSETNSHGRPAPPQAASPQTEVVHEEERRYWLFSVPAAQVEGVMSTRIRQGYFKVNERIRIYEGIRAEHTVKTGKGGSNMEANTPMELDQAERLLAQAPCQLAKLRYKVPVDPSSPEGLMWEIDLYQGAGLGAVKLEVERPKGWRGAFPPPLPPWAEGAVDVTDELSDYWIAYALRDFSPGRDVPSRLLQAARACRRMRR